MANEFAGVEAAVAGLQGAWDAQAGFAWRGVTIRRTEAPELVVTTARSEAPLRTGRRYADGDAMRTRFRNGEVIEHAEDSNPLPVLEAYGGDG